MAKATKKTAPAAKRQTSARKSAAKPSTRKSSAPAKPRKKAAASRSSSVKPQAAAAAQPQRAQPLAIEAMPFLLPQSVARAKPQPSIPRPTRADKPKGSAPIRTAPAAQPSPFSLTMPLLQMSANMMANSARAQRQMFDQMMKFPMVGTMFDQQVRFIEQMMRTWQPRRRK